MALGHYGQFNLYLKDDVLCDFYKRIKEYDYVSGFVQNIELEKSNKALRIHLKDAQKISYHLTMDYPGAAATNFLQTLPNLDPLAEVVFTPYAIYQHNKCIDLIDDLPPLDLTEAGMDASNRTRFLEEGIGNFLVRRLCR